MPLEVGDLGAVEEDVLAGTSDGLLLFDLELDDIGRVLNDLGDVGAVTRADLAQDALEREDQAADKPIPLYRLSAMSMWAETE